MLFLWPVLFLLVSERALLQSCRRCFASLFTNRAISYRTLKGFDHFDVGLSIGVQKMVRSDSASSGVMFSLDTESGFGDVVRAGHSNTLAPGAMPESLPLTAVLVISYVVTFDILFFRAPAQVMLSGAWGLGENIVQGAVNPDEWYVFKPKLEEGFRPIVGRTLGSKHKRMIYSNRPGEFVRNVPTTNDMRTSYCIDDDEVLQLANWACTIEKHYSGIRGTYTPMDIEWAKDGRTGELFIVQARPETVHSQSDATKLKRYVMDSAPESVVEGSSVGAKIGSGEVQVIMETAGISDFKPGQVLVTEMTDPYVPCRAVCGMWCGCWCPHLLSD